MCQFIIRFGLLLLVVLMFGCGTAQQASDKGTVVVDFYKIIQKCPAILKLQDESIEAAYIKEMEALLNMQSELLKKVDMELSAIKNKNSLEFRDKQAKLMYPAEQNQKKIIDLSMSRVIDQMKAYDVALKQMQLIALEEAKKLGARVVLPVLPLPSPNPDINYPRAILREPQMEGARHWQGYNDKILQRQVFTHDPRVDITNRVLIELKKRHQWK